MMQPGWKPRAAGWMQPQRLSEMESLALENNVVNWVLSRARVADKSVSFDELMGGA